MSSNKSLCSSLIHACTLTVPIFKAENENIFFFLLIFLLAKVQSLLPPALLWVCGMWVVSGLINLASFFSTSSFLQSPSHWFPWLDGAGVTVAVLSTEQSVPWAERGVAWLASVNLFANAGGGCSSQNQTGCPTSAVLPHTEKQDARASPILPHQRHHSST